MENSPEKPEKPGNKKPKSIQIIIGDDYMGCSIASIVWPGENLKKKIKEYSKDYIETGRIRIIDVPYDDQEFRNDHVQAMKAMDKVMGGRYKYNH